MKFEIQFLKIFIIIWWSCVQLTVNSIPQISNRIINASTRKSLSDLNSFSSRKDDDDLRNFQCFHQSETEKYRKIFNDGYKNPIGIQVSGRATHQLTSRIFGIYLREILGYQYVNLIPIEMKTQRLEEDFKLHHALNQLVVPEGRWPMPIIDLEVWMLPDYHAVPSVINDAGLVLDPGRFGWFVPKNFIDTNRYRPAELYQELHYSIFTDPMSNLYASYVIDIKILNELKTKFGPVHQLTPTQCQNITCVTLLAESYVDTSFIKYQLNNETNFQFYVQVIWFEENFRSAIDWIHKTYRNSIHIKDSNKKFLILHWSPSDIIDADQQYEMITMPKCEAMSSSSLTLCKYEMTPILKYYAEKFKDLRNGLQAFSDFYLTRTELQGLLIESNLAKIKVSNSMTAMKTQYNRIACNWLKLNKGKYTKSVEKNQVNITIGGIFPLTGNGRAYGNILTIVEKAVRAINDNESIIPGFSLNVNKNDGACRADTVMKAFIHYFSAVKSPLIGVLGPACSETVEPIAGISKHTRMTVISYSAEGATFTDRDTYPYFFRTIGSNRQYEKVFMDLFKRLKWRRVAALTEDGQKYTEYISHMETIMKQENMELILNKKFTKDVSQSGMRRLLLELKSKQAKIIIADIYNDNAQLVMCEAYQLQMTAKHGYVWFLPVWLSRSWMNGSRSDRQPKVICTQDQLYEAIDGHFSLTHAPFATNSSIMDLENKTVGAWLNEFNSTDISDYAGFVYDAVWVYALAVDKLIRNDSTAINDLRSQEIVKKFVDIIWQTDFNGLSGRIRFDKGGSRINDVNVLQWINQKFYQIGKYIPTTVRENGTLKINGGTLNLNESLINWFTKDRPTDGTFVCQLATLADLLHTDCDNVVIILTSVLCLILVVTISFASFMFWKRQYYKKLKRSAKVMRNFGIDLLSPNEQTFNTLDKWEVPKEKIVINRRLGEGAFGTVYGGEAQLSETGWTAVAVKTLKIGASTEDRLDFLSEAEAMKRFDHKNIVKFLGVCLQTEPVYTIMEFMLYGDLKTFLLARRHLVIEKVSDDSDISSRRLTMYTLDVARGLSYLANEKYVHRDIACRNCLVNAQRVVKIGDFGMARPTFENDYYRFNRKGMLPVRWMAPESLGLGVFTPASDVWSFGVLLYEIITFGSFPYQGLTNKEALEYINRGEILPIPQGTKPHLEALMKSCWCQENKKRPNASEIVEYISNYPRLLTPCLDVPLSSVQMGETDSDQLEILPRLRQRITTQTDLDILPASSSTSANTNNFNQQDYNHRSLENINIPFMKKPANGTVPISSTSESNSNDDNNLYSVMSPLIRTNPDLSDMAAAITKIPFKDTTLNVNSRTVSPSTSQSNGGNNCTNLNSYSAMSPLLQINPDLSNSESSLLLRYVPMHGINNSQNERSKKAPTKLSANDIEMGICCNGYIYNKHCNDLAKHDNI